ncbi:MAG: TIM-barrel domain-containing protein [Candidatus Cryptobacteroides sp.]|jgi:alpha-D-xyloside xylohydrolase
MKKLAIAITALALSLPLPAQQAEVTVDGTRCRITYFTPSIVRVEKIPSGAKEMTDESLVIVKAPESVSVIRRENARAVTLRSSSLTTVVDKMTGQIRFLRNGRILLREKSHDFEAIGSGPDRGSFKVGQVFILDPEEALYGIGVIQDGLLNRRGTRKFMEQSNVEDFQNVIQSVKGWGLYFDNYSRAWFDDGPEGMSFTSEVGDKLDYYFISGGSGQDVIAGIRDLSGSVPMFPLWTFGYWQCRERYKSTREVMEVVDRYREAGIPLDGIIQDWQYWGGNYLWNAMEFLNENYADAQKMIDHVHEQNAHIMISIWASFGPMTKPYRELDEKGLLFNFQTWPQSGLSAWPPRMDYPSGVRCYMPYSKEARDIYWKYLKGMFDMGIDAWWMDSTDPDFFNAKESDYDQMTPEGSFRRLRNAFPLASVRGVYENQRNTTSDKRVFIMTRSAFAGQQRYGSNMWSGDVTSSWDMLRKQVPAGLNFTMTGNPNFNTDIGGFFAGDYNYKGGHGLAATNPQYGELYVRWMQYGLFCPVFRSHGADAPKEIYQFGKAGDPVYDAIANSIRLRYSLLPYLYSTAWEVTSQNGSYMLPLSARFPKDRKTWDIGDEFLFGSSILAAPILKAQYTPEEISRSPIEIDFKAGKTTEAYLPADAAWYDFWTERRFEGGRTATVETSLDRVPMFVKAGSILPLAPVMQYAEEEPWDDLEIRIYPGADAEFTLYEDEGDNYNYEKGTYSTITFKWDDRRRRLTPSGRQGAFPGMLTQRVFRIRIVGQGPEKQVNYVGRETVL